MLVMVDEKKKNLLEQKRASPRVDFFSRVHVIPEDCAPIDVFSSNVSSGGIFLRSNRPLPTGKKVKLQFETNNGMVHVDEGEIVWNRSFDPVGGSDQASGMGIKFRSMSEQSRKKIETFIDEILDTSRTQASTPNKPPTVVSHKPTRSTQSAKEPISTARPPPMSKTPVVLEPPGNSSPPDLSAAPRSPVLQAATFGPRTRIEPQFMASISPTSNKRVLLFAGFVLLVALVTFFTMFLIRPTGEETGGLGRQGTIPQAKSSSQPSLASPADAKKNEPNDAGAKSVPVSGKDAATADAAKKPEVKAPAGSTKTDANEQPALANIKESSSDQLEVGPPVFEQGPRGWQMTIIANRSCEIKHFALNDPPRLAIDFPKASFTGKFVTLEAPAPTVSKLRVGKQEWGVRFVIDFQGNEAPLYKVKVEPESITVNFNPKSP